MREAAVVELGADGRAARGDVAQTFAKGELGEGQDQKLFVSGEGTDTMVAAVATNALVEFVLGELGDKMSAHGSAFVQAEHGGPKRARGPSEGSARK